MQRIIYTTGTFDKWFTGLKDRQARARIQARIDRIEDGHFGDCKPVGSGVSELRIHYGAGYRLYFIQQGFEVVILLAGGDKSSQSNDIKKAIELVKEMKNNENG